VTCALRVLSLGGSSLFRMMPVCTENLDPDVVVMKPAKDRV
jgi:hypothetical protein